MFSKSVNIIAVVRVQYTGGQSVKANKSSEGWPEKNVKNEQLRMRITTQEGIHMRNQG